MLTFSVESWFQFLPESKALWEEHWAEVGQDKVHMAKPDPDTDEYRRLWLSGILHVVVARQEGKLVGYHLWFVRRHLHYRSILAAFGDMYFLAPSCRVGRNAQRFFEACEKSLTARGVQVLYSAHKLGEKTDHSRFFSFLGFVWKEKSYSKWIGS